MALDAPRSFVVIVELRSDRAQASGIPAYFIAVSSAYPSNFSWISRYRCRRLPSTRGGEISRQSLRSKSSEMLSHTCEELN